MWQTTRQCIEMNEKSLVLQAKFTTVKWMIKPQWLIKSSSKECMYIFLTAFTYTKNYTNTHFFIFSFVFHNRTDFVLWSPAFLFNDYDRWIVNGSTSALIQKSIITDRHVEWALIGLKKYSLPLQLY